MDVQGSGYIDFGGRLSLNFFKAMPGKMAGRIAALVWVLIDRGEVEERRYVDYGAIREWGENIVKPKFMSCFEQNRRSSSLNRSPLPVKRQSGAR